MEQRGVANSGTNSLYNFRGKSVGVVDLCSLSFRILVTTSASWIRGAYRGKEGRQRGDRLQARVGLT